MNLSWDLGRKVVPVVHKTSAPSGTDTAYNVPTLWLDDTANVAYLLVDITSGTATWRQLQTNVSNMTTATDPAANAATTAAIVAAYSGTIITTTAAGNSQTLASPSVTTAGRTFMVINNDTSTHSIPVVANGVTFTITPGEAQMFIWDGTAWGPIDLGITEIPVKVVQGGTGASTLTDHGVLLGSGTDPITALGAMTNGQLVIGKTGADPVVASITDGEGIDITAGAGTLTIACEDASTSNKGVVALATNAEAIAGTDTAKAVTSDDLRYVLDYLADLITAGLAHAIDGIGVLGKEIENIRLRVLMTGQVTITNANTGQPHWLMTTALTTNVSLPYSLPNANYTVLVEIEDADFKERVGEIKISSKAVNGFTITVTGNTNNIDLRWTVVDPNFWTR